MNELRFEGRIDKITIKNEKVVKFTLVNRKNKRITGTVFNSQSTCHIYEKVEELLGQTVTITGEMYETSYQDKKTNQWIKATAYVFIKWKMKRNWHFKIIRKDRDLAWTSKD